LKRIAFQEESIEKRSRKKNCNTMSQVPLDDADVAAADKQMEERANRAKDLLAQRYRGLQKQQVSSLLIVHVAYK
jgi:hypothetical protein